MFKRTINSLALMAALNNISKSRHNILVVDCHEIAYEKRLYINLVNIQDWSKPCLIKNKQSWHKQNRGRLSKKARR